jgi:hypothetical protein
VENILTITVVADSPFTEDIAEFLWRGMGRVNSAPIGIAMPGTLMLCGVDTMFQTICKIIFAYDENTHNKTFITELMGRCYPKNIVASGNAYDEIDFSGLKLNDDQIATINIAIQERHKCSE